MFVYHFYVRLDIYKSKLDTFFLKMGVFQSQKSQNLQFKVRTL